MNEQKLIKKQLIKNMFYTFIVFAIILIFFDAIIYNQISVSLYKSIDKELDKTAENYIKYAPKQITISDGNKITSIVEFKINPRLIYIIRDSSGNITNSESIGRLYKDYLLETKFNKNILNKIYPITVQDDYNYRGITIKLETETGENYYVQLLANVDGEVETLKNVTDVLLVGSLIIIVVAILATFIILSLLTYRFLYYNYILTY